MGADDEFYEDDEPIEVIRAIVARPADGRTTRPVDRNLSIPATFNRGVVLGVRRDDPSRLHRSAELIESP